MKKLVTALMILLPLVFLVTLFTVTNITAITTPVSVTGITIGDKGEDGIFAFDIATYEAFNESELGIIVYPSEASNKDYRLTVTDIATGAAVDCVSVDGDNNFVLTDAGNFRLTYTTVDGGFSDSVLFAVTSSGVLDFTPTLADNFGQAIALEQSGDNYAAAVTCGTYDLSALMYPQATIAESVTYSSNDAGIKVNALTGEVTLFLGGEYTVDVTVKGVKGKDIVRHVKLNASLNATLEEAVAINGYAGLESVEVAQDSNSTVIFIQSQEALSLGDITASGALKSYNVEALDEHRFAVTLQFADNHGANEHYELTVGALHRTLDVRFVERAIYVYSATSPQGVENNIVMLTDSTMSLAVDTDGDNMAFEWEVLGNDGVTLSAGTGSVVEVSTPSQAGAATLSIHAYFVDENGDPMEDEDGNPLDDYYKSRTLIITPRYTSLLFAQAAQNTALSDVLAYAGKKIDDQGNITTQTFLPLLKDGAKTVSDPIDIEWDTDSHSMATVDENGVVTIHATGRVTLTARWKYAETFGVQNAATYTFLAVDGVEVNTKEQLLQANSRELVVVLGSNIYLGEDLFDHETTVVGGIETDVRTPKYDDATMAQYLRSWTHDLPTTWDWTYYANHKKERPNVRYIMEINASMYGNGHFISTEYITDMLDPYGNLYPFAVFTGPLDFVSTNRDEQGLALAAVKGQDNVSFLVRKNQLTLENVVLKGCDDEALYIVGDNGQKQIDLTRLNYCGTTLELMADVDLHACRVQNGRTVVRAYGRDGVDMESGVIPESERIHVTIDKCVLSNAREFILKLGANRYVKGTGSNPSPYLTDGKGKNYRQHNSSACDALINDETFYNRNVLTDVTLKDSTLATSGLFTIGMESHFAGKMLTGEISIGKQFLDGWKDLAGTSYSAALRLVGDVKLSDWKDMANVDSSTLIETMDLPNSPEGISFLKLNVRAMLEAVQQYGGEQFKDIVKPLDGKTMVHGGIAMYGGGKNYHIVDMTQWDYAALATTYNVNLTVLNNDAIQDEDIRAQGRLLPGAAGEEDFRFIMYDAKSYEQTVNQ